ncbi:MAG: hypothetical protein RMJ43_05210 [Chloroherpetonaceae bacterium]|nr:hypothetical protein [Chthonomonadaceae bacterium]MDW8207215.1 hypothetical protein [Chloroherpetonaceae bacterium]
MKPLFDGHYRLRLGYSHVTLAQHSNDAGLIKPPVKRKGVRRELAVLSCNTAASMLL